MINLFKKLFKRQKNDLSLSNKIEYNNVKSFLDGSANLNLTTPLESRSTSYFKSVSDVFEKSNSEEENLEALQSYIAKNDENHSDSELTMIPEEETALFHNKGV